jgi:hypothetical protein
MTDEPDAFSRLRVISIAEHDPGPSGLSVDLLRTLRQLERRTRSGQLEAVNIRHAQELAGQGLAHHGRGGWTPTREGLAYLEDLDRAGATRGRDPHPDTGS